AIKIDPENDEFYVDRGRTYAYIGDVDRALDELDRAHSLNPSNADAWRVKGNIYYKLDDRETSVNCYKRAVEFGSTTSETYQALAKAEESLGHLEEALDAY